METQIIMIRHAQASHKASPDRPDLIRHPELSQITG
jgi:hypothetical protein